MSARRRVLIFLAFVLVAVGLDQATKAWALTLPVRPVGCDITALDAACVGAPAPVIAGFWDWEVAMNDGAAFSNLAGNTLLLTALAFGGVLLLVAMAARARPEQRLKRAALAVMIGGTVGNLIDRVRWGAVVDFVRWRVHDHRWPIFNVADALLLVGVVLLVIDELRGRQRGVLAEP
jgi:signal peptidase II